MRIEFTGGTLYVMLSPIVIGPHWAWFDEGKTELKYFRCHDENGAEDGTWVTWRTGGEKWKKFYTYKNGKREGPFKRWYPNGKVMDYGTYVDDKLHGSYRSFHDDGCPLCSSEYDHGELLSEECKSRSECE